MAKALTRLSIFWKTSAIRHIAHNRVLGKASDLIPNEPVWKFHDESELPPRTKITPAMLKHLEQQSFVSFKNDNDVKILEAAIRFADQLSLVDTEGVEPLVTLLEDLELPMRSDEPEDTDPNIVNLAKEVFEGYYVAPLANVEHTGEDISQTGMDERYNGNDGLQSKNDS